MKTEAFIFDMDGLLIDSEPLWEEAGSDILKQYDITLTTEQYHSSTGLRTREWIDHWFSHFKIDMAHSEKAVADIIQQAIDKIGASGIVLPGVEEVLKFLSGKGYKIGLATSSPLSLVDVVIDKLKIREYFSVLTSAEPLAYGKPHPEVYINCAKSLDVLPIQCVCFEDSFNGMIAAKAARMKCVVVPAPQFQQQKKWNAADLQLGSLLEFGEEQLVLLG